MKLVLVSINSKYVHSSLAVWYLKAAMEEAAIEDVETVIVEGTINEKVDDIERKIVEEEADVIGFSSYIWNINRVLEISKKLYEKSGVKIILGGPEVSYRPEDILKSNPFIDAVLCGEGEWILPQLMLAYSQKKPIHNIEGVCARAENKIIINEAVVSDKLPPNPYTDEYFKSLNGRIVYFESSRGCPFSCAFCLSGRCGKVRYFTFKEASENLVRLANSGTQTIKFVDRTFNANHKRTNDWLRFIINEWGKRIPEDVCFHFEIAGDLLKEDTIELMQGLPKGMVQLEIGLQSFNPETLSAVTRKTNTERLKENIKKLLSFENMHIHLDLIMGLPYEDMEKIRSSFNEAFSLRPHMLQVGFLKLLYGAAMRENIEKYPCEYNKEAPYEVISTPWLEKEDIRNLHILEDCVERIYNSGRLLDTMEYVFACTGMDAFEFFMNIGAKMSKFIYVGISFNDYEEKLYDVLVELKGVDAGVLRDMMVIDRLKTDVSGRIPAFLKVEDENLRRIKKLLNSRNETCVIPGVKRGIALIYSQNKAAYVDYVNRNPVTGRYKINYVKMEMDISSHRK